MEADVDHRLAAVDLLVVGLERLRERVPGAWMQKSTSVVVPPNAAAVVPEVKSSHVVVPPKNISMCVCGSIAPGITILPVGVDHLVGRHVERLADQRHRAVVDEDVPDVVVGRGDDAAALDQHGHRAPTPF